MSSYTTIDGLLKRMDAKTLSQLTDDTDTSTPSYETTAATAVANQAISDASFIVDGYVIGHIDMTDGTNQARMEPYTCSIALYKLHTRRHVTHEQNPKAAEYDDAIKFLVGVRDGKLHTTADVQTRTISSTRASEDRFFTDTKIDGFIQQ